MFVLHFTAKMEAAPPALGKRAGAGSFMQLASCFYGYLATYVFSLYGKRTSCLEKMTIKEVEEAIGDESSGYLINVS